MFKIGYLCLGCFEEYKQESIKLNESSKYDYNTICPKANCYGDVVEIDDLLLPVIKLLNQKGYITTFCCSGHSYEAGYCNTYISFDNEYLPNIIPKGFIVEDKQWYKENYPKCYDENKEDICIRKYYGKDLNEYELHKEICKTAIGLMKWAEKLECLE